jgi:SPX domain protein involved in polyphosphate accumulation
VKKTTPGTDTDPKRGAQEIPPVLDRYEAKYTIPATLIDDISAFIRPYCSLDKYSEREPDMFYKINSLYFDSPGFAFLRQRLCRAPNRFNMRVRTYGDAPQLPYFLEIKQKKGDIVRKYRAKVFETNIHNLLCCAASGEESGGAEDAANTDLFRRMVHTYNAQPQVVVQYRRKAYISECDDYARVTFDKELRYRRETRYVPLPVENEMAPCDIETCFDPGACVILELKCYTKFVPLWMLDLVRAFQLKQRGFSKFSTCMRPIFARYSCGGWPVRSSLACCAP